MKTLMLTLLVFLMVTSGSKAANTTFNMNYPATGTYKQINFQNLKEANPTSLCTSNNQGLLFYNPLTNALEMCSSVNGAVVNIPYNQTCFNRFSTSNTFTCPKINNIQYIQGDFTDSFITAAGTTVYSTVCCSNNNIARP
jgi:hypothetical protein